MAIVSGHRRLQGGSDDGQGEVASSELQLQLQVRAQLWAHTILALGYCFEVPGWVIEAPATQEGRQEAGVTLMSLQASGSLRLKIA